MKTQKFQIFTINTTIMTLLISLCNNYLIIPFTIKNPTIKMKNNLIDASEYLEYIKKSLIATKIYTGTPEKETEIYLTMETYDFFLGKGFCLQNSNSLYYPSSSSTYKKDQYVTISSPFFSNGSKCEDNFTFYNNLNLTKNNSIDQINFLYGIASNELFNIIYPDLICGYFGLQFTLSTDLLEYHSIIYQLKSRSKIKNKYWSVIFYDDKEEKINNYDGVLVIGINQSDYETFFNSEDYNITHSVEYGIKNRYWEIKFNEIYYYNNKQNYSFFTDIYSQIVIDYNYIICNEDYFNSILNIFFNKYIEKGICFIDKNETSRTGKKKDQLINIIICDKNKFKDKKKFPTLYFKLVDFYTIFEFDYKDLFQEIGNSLVFSIVFDEENKSHWTLGRIFLKKYQFIFDNDQRIITYIKKNKIKKEDNKKNNFNIVIFLKIMLIAFLLIGFGAGIILGKKLWDKNRKKRANELTDDDYDYQVNN